MLNMVKTDGGRSQDKQYNFERKDCVVRAFAIGCGVPYGLAHIMVERVWNRKFQKSTKDFTKKMIAEWGEFRFVEQYGITEYSWTVNTFTRHHPTGTYLLCLQGHVVTIKHGVQYDLGRIIKRSRVFRAWEVVKLGE